MKKAATTAVVPLLGVLASLEEQVGDAVGANIGELKSLPVWTQALSCSSTPVRISFSRVGVW